MFDVRYSNYFNSRLYANTSDVILILGYWILSHRWILSEVDSGYYPTQMERHDWSDSFVYVTILNIHMPNQYFLHFSIVAHTHEKKLKGITN